jgi:selenide,water dikinase
MDDAAVVRPEGAVRALCVTMDVITPIVDDARSFGAIAAANSLSDVYAMGGRPEVALSFVGLPTDLLGNEVVEEVMSGLSDVCLRARCAIVGGHTMKDSEPKCGLAVIGSVEPDALWSHRFAEVGDVLVLTKPIGTGLIGQAVRAGTADVAALAAATRQMMALNDVACDVGRRFGARACTDVTGFGLLGHLRHIAEASGVEVEIDVAAVPLLPTALDLARGDCIPGGTRKNLAYVAGVARFDAAVDDALRLVLCDAQTSGGLLLCLPADRADEAIAALLELGASCAAAIGRVVARGAGAILVR